MAVAKSASTTARSSRPRTWVWTLAALTCVLFGALLPYDMHEINQGVVSSLAVVCILIMSLWMHHIGAHDLPARGRELVPSRLGVVLLGYGATAVIAHEGLLAPLGLDLLSWWRDTAQRLPLSALAWAVPAVLLAWRAPREIVRVLQDQPLARITLPLTGLVALGALAIAARHAAQPVDALGLRFYSADYGVVSLALLAAACRSRRHDEPWRLLALFMALAPALWPPLWLIGYLCDQHYVVAMWFAATVALTTTTAYAFLTAFGVRMPVAAAPGH